MVTPVRDPVQPDLIRAELGASSLVRTFRGIEIHATDAQRAPNLMQEIGRIREIEFRAEGGGTGKPADIDEYDTGDRPFRQLVAWDPDAGELVGMYRFLPAAAARRPDGTYTLPTARLFEFSPRFRDETLPQTVELGRSVVNRSARRAIMGLFAVWSGLGAIVAEHPEIRAFFGKFTTYPSYHPLARAHLMAFLALYCGDPGGDVVPRSDLAVVLEADGSLEGFAGTDYDRDFALLGERIKSLGETIPPLVISYLGLSRTMRCYGTARNPHFGGVYETAILVTIADIHEKQRARFVESYESVNPTALAW